MASEGGHDSFIPRGEACVAVFQISGTTTRYLISIDPTSDREFLVSMV